MGQLVWGSWCGAAGVGQLVWGSRREGGIGRPGREEGVGGRRRRWGEGGGGGGREEEVGGGRRGWGEGGGDGGRAGRRQCIGGAC